VTHGWRRSYYGVVIYVTLGWMGPLAILGYFVVGAVLSRLSLAPLVSLTARQEQLEGDFRREHHRVLSLVRRRRRRQLPARSCAPARPPARPHARAPTRPPRAQSESIAFYDNADAPASALRQRLLAAVRCTARGGARGGGGGWRGPALTGGDRSAMRGVLRGGSSRSTP
jgi:hypothetical protein